MARAVACIAVAVLALPAAAQPPASGGPAAPGFATVASTPAEFGGGADRLSAAQSCEPTRTGWYASAGADLMVVKPLFESNPAYTLQTSESPLLGPTRSTRRIQEFDYPLTLNPRVWVALTHAESGIGVRLRWFGFDQRGDAEEFVNDPVPLTQLGVTRLATSISPLLAIYLPTSFPAVNSIQTGGGPPVSDRLRFTTQYKLDLWDLDATVNDMELGENWRSTVFAGVRYMHLSQRYDASSTGLVSQFLESGHNFVGVGPTGGIELCRALCGCGSGLSAYGALRYTVLIGNATHSSSGLGVGLIPNPLQPGLTFHDDRVTRHMLLPMIDFEVGADWVRSMGPVELLLRPAFVSILFPKGSGSSGNGNMGVVGVSVTTGLRY